MTSMMVFLIAFGGGCLTGAVLGFWFRDRRASESSRAPLFLALPADE